MKQALIAILISPLIMVAIATAIVAHSERGRK